MFAGLTPEGVTHQLTGNFGSRSQKPEACTIDRFWLLSGLGHLFDHPRATAVGEGLLVGLLDDLDFHDSVLLVVVDECELPSRLFSAGAR
jgi:hypothetical protein